MQQTQQTQQQQQARPPRIRVSYTIRTEDDTRHRFGINSLAIDSSRRTLYSAGRDGIARSWQLGGSGRSQSAAFKLSFDSHSDWVNDIALCPNDIVMTASADTTVKVWSTDGPLLSTLSKHSDYVKALAVASEAQVAFSGGLDKKIYAWDLNTSKPSELVNRVSELAGHEDSIYSLVVNPSGSLLVSGSTEKLLRVWDPRECKKLGKLRGHTDNVKSILLSPDATLCVSASSDKSIRIWDMRQLKLLNTILCHTDAVWSLAADPAFTTLYSAGRSGDVYATNLTSFESEHVLKEAHPVLKICLDDGNESGLWVATTGSTLRKWSLRTKAESPSPVCVVDGAPAIIKYHVMNNKCHVLTLDSAGSITLWDVLRGIEVKRFGKDGKDANFDDLTKPNDFLIINSWFSPDTKLGLLTINLDQSQCFNAEAYAIDVGYNVENEDLKINLGSAVLHSLFSNWVEIYTKKETPADTPAVDGDSGAGQGSEGDSQQTDATQDSKGSKPASSVPDTQVQSLLRDGFRHPSRIMVSLNDMSSGVSGGGVPICRLTIESMASVWHTPGVSSSMPQWVADCLLHDFVPNNVNTYKMNFLLSPHPHQLGEPLPVLPEGSQSRLSALRILRMKKLCKYVTDKLVIQVPPDKKPDDMIELWCNDKRLEGTYNMAAVRHFFWNSSDDLQLYYRRNANSVGGKEKEKEKEK